jgi:CubicO group peptidase (beta-lactamase class C family)
MRWARPELVNEAIMILPFRLVALFLALCTLPSFAAADGFDRYVQLQIERQHIPGLTLAIVRGDRVLKLRGYGLADVEQSVAANIGTVYEIGSVTKSFTSMAVLLLRERERLALDDPLGKYLPDVPDTWKPVTIRQLLSHTSGVPDYEEVMGYESYRLAMTPAQVYAYVAAKPLDFAPGSRWNYSNTGYYLLSLVIEKVSGETYIDFVTKHILVPAGMAHTRSSEPNDVIPHRASGYDYSDRMRNRDAMQPSATGGAGMLVSTIGDMVRWAAVIRKKEILKPESYALMFTDTLLADGGRSGYGFGWFVAAMRDHRAITHSGGTAGFACNFLYLPDDDVTIIVLMNTGTANPTNFTDHFARVMVPGLRYATIPEQRPEVGKLLLDLYAHRAQAEPYLAPFTGEFGKQVAPYWSASLDYYKALGAPLGAELVELFPGEESFRYRVRYRDTNRLVRVTLDASGKISGLTGTEE